MRIAVVGATGLVGGKMMQVLAERNLLGSQPSSRAGPLEFKYEMLVPLLIPFSSFPSSTPQSCRAAAAGRAAAATRVRNAGQ